jgi:acetyl-CoA carboxylase biotin carboxyl carrier protein
MSKLNDSVIVDQLSEKDLSGYADFYESNKLEELTIEEKGVKITLKRQAAQIVVAGAMEKPAVTTGPTKALEKAAEAPAKNPNAKEIRSPIVGTFYASSSPDSEPYAKVGDIVTAESKIGIVEAMKIMNEISSGVSGKVVEILVKNGQSVTANQVLMLVE